ncbi:minor capsid protein [Clostridium fessum]|uniref:minor capsid protein n=1 Tax=Clostridium fessum TaxID=2126740 RepID=UPI0022E00B0A|nr:minor capsid protein [Clostridium fessum]
MMDVEIKWNKTSDQIAKEKTRGNDGLLFLANEAKRLMDPYVPADSLALAQNVSVRVEGDTGVIEYQSPYAHYQYKGVAYGPNYPLMDGGAVMGYYSPPHKSSTGKKLKYSHFRHPQATSEWDKAMMRARKGDLVRALENYLGGK